MNKLDPLSIQMNEKDLVNGADGRHLLSILPTLRAEIRAMEQAVDNAARSAMTKHDMSPELAKDLWVEKGIYAKILSRVEQKIRAAGLIIPVE